MDEPNHKPEPLDYRPAAPPAAGTGERVGAFLVAALATPVMIASAVLGGLAVMTGNAAGVLGLAFAAACGLVVSLSFRDPARRSAAVAGGACGIVVCLLLVGACFAMLSHA